MIVLVARYHCKDGNAEQVHEYLKEMKPLVEKHEENCLIYEVSRSQENANLFLIYEKYTDQAALTLHRETPHFEEIILGKIIPLLEKREVEYFDII